MTAGPLISGITLVCRGLGEERTQFCLTPSRQVSPAWEGSVWWPLGSCLMVISETAWFSLSVILNGANGHLRFRFCYSLEPS